MKQLFLSRRNLEALLSKLDRVKAGERSFCQIIKHPDPESEYCNSDPIVVTAVEDELIYAHRCAGAIHPKDEPPLRHETGTTFVDALREVQW